MIPLLCASLVALAFASDPLARNASSHWLLAQGLEALGGFDNLDAIVDVVYSGGYASP